MSFLFKIFAANLRGGDISYDLKTDFSGVPGQPVTFTNGQVLDTAAEGVIDGSLIVVDTGTGSVKVVSNELEITGSATWHQSGLYEPDGVSRALGKTLFFTREQAAAKNTLFGFNASATIDLSAAFGVFITNVDILYYRATGPVVGSIANGTAYQFLLIAGGSSVGGISFKTGDIAGDFLYGGRLLVKGGAFSVWTLLYVDENANDATLYAFINANSPSAENYSNIRTLENVLDVDVMFDPAYLTTSPDESDHDTGVSDFIMEVVFTTPGAGTDPLDIRYRKAGTNDHWLVRITPGTVGTDIEIIEDNSGEVQRASADIDWATTTEYKVTIIVDGDSYQRVYVNGVLKMTYTTTNTFNETETTINLLKNSFTVSMIAVHNRTDSAWDTEISSATGETY